MKPRICLYFFIPLFLLSKESFAQKTPLDFNLVSGSNGISIGKITGITQDKWGYMWFVDQTNYQLIRYDGYGMKTYRNDPAHTNSINTSGFECIAADTLGNIWLPTNNGVDKLNSLTGISTHYRFNKNSSCKGGYTAAIIVDHLNSIWLGTGDGLYTLDQKTGNFTCYSHHDNDQTSLSCNTIRALYEDHEGTIWVGTGLPFDTLKEGGLNKFNRTTGKFTRYMHDDNNPHSLINDKIRAIFEDSRGVFWVGTQGDGLHIMNRKTGTFERLTYDPAHPEKLSRPPVKKGDSGDHITFITEDISGEIWIGSYLEGLTRYDPVTKKITHFIGDKSGSQGFKDSTTWNAFISNDGELWITTETINTETAKLYRTDPFHKSITTIHTGDPANSFSEDQNGNLWVGTEGNGILKFDQHYNLLQHFKHNPSDSSSILEDHTWVNFLPNEDKVLSESYYGLRVLDKHTNKFSRFSNDTAFRDSKVSGFVDFIQDKQGIYWFTNWGSGLIRYDPKNNSTKQFTNNPKDSSSISSNTLNHIIEDSKGRLWIAGGSGLNKLNRKTDGFKRYITETFIESLYEDSRNNIWAGTLIGLYRYDERKDTFALFFDHSSMLYSIGVGGIIEDNNHNLWFNSNSSIIRLNPLTKQFFIYGDKFGIGSNSMAQWAKSYKNKKGQLLYGYGDGFCIFYPQELDAKTNLKIILTGFFINTIPVVPGKKSIIQQPVEELNDLNLKYNQNNIAFNFAAIDYRKPEATKYFTLLENYDNTWREAVGEKNSAYFNVPPGTYVYRVRAYNSEGVKAEKAITIRIYPPWWQTWWFRISVVILLAAIFYLLIRWWLHRKFRLQLERTERGKQLAELKQKATELEMQALRSQMNPHFIFNSLNSINMFILENNKLQASEYLSKFSKLIRLILQNSQEAFIPLERELEALQLYLELESLRFANKFEYKIAVEDNIDTTMLKVPPLIIQPYTENAIWHGLMHKKEKGYLEIEVYEEDEILFYKITDDGIGRKKAAELKSKSASMQKSMGMRITADRIAMLQQQNKTSITITDLVLADGNPGGTEVLIEIPVAYD
jgi:ligand-binding sensor domain-containing protein